MTIRDYENEIRKGYERQASKGEYQSLRAKLYDAKPANWICCDWEIKEEISEIQQAKYAQAVEDLRKQEVVVANLYDAMHEMLDCELIEAALRDHQRAVDKYRAIEVKCIERKYECDYAEKQFDVYDDD